MLSMSERFSTLRPVQKNISISSLINSSSKKVKNLTKSGFNRGKYINIIYLHIDRTLQY